MAQAAAMLAGLIALWFMLSPRLEDAAALAIGAAAAILACAGGLWLAGREPARSGPRRGSALQRAFCAVRAGARVTRAAIAPSGLRPAFVKVKSRAGDHRDRASDVEYIAARLGAIVVEIEPDGVLLHALDEDAIDAQALRGLDAAHPAGGAA